MKIAEVKKSLPPEDQLQFDMIYNSQKKDPTIALILSVVLGYLGVDRFYTADYLLGAAKLVTCGGFFIWWVVDLFLIVDAANTRNLANANEAYRAILISKN